MDREINKIYKQLRFYNEQESKIQLKIYEDKTLPINGTITKLFYFFHPYVIIKLDSGSSMKIYLEDVIEGTIFPSEIEVKQSYNRKSIPKSVRKELWRNHFGDRFKGKCYVCKERIYKDSFEAGHIEAYANGGEDRVENLRPICKTCNRSMGTQNLEEFKQQYH